MTRPVADLVKHLWPGTGNSSPIDLGAAAPGFFAFPLTLNNQVISYSIEHANGAERETGIGTYTHTPPRLTRSFVTQSTAGAPTKQAFTAGTKHVRLTALGLDVVENRAITNPGINDDISVGYIEGRSRWLNYQSKQLFFCVDHTVGAALWLQVMAPPFDAGLFNPAAIDLSRGQLEYDSYTQTGAITAFLAGGVTPGPGGSVAVNIIGGGFAFNFDTPFVGLEGLTSGTILESGTSYPFFIRFQPDWQQISPGVFADRVLVGAIGLGTGGGGGLIPTSVKTSAYTAVPGELVRTDSSGGGFNVTLPLNPPDGAYVSLLDVAIGGSWVADPVTVLRNGAAIGGVLDDVLLDVDVRQLDLVYGTVANDWVASFTTAFAVAGPSGTPVPFSRLVATHQSLTGGGDLSADLLLSLVNDQTTPGQNRVYGTDGNGNRLWKNDPVGTLPTLTGNALRLLRVNTGATGVEWVPPSALFVNTSGTQASQPSGGKWKMTGAITNVPVTNGWEGFYLNFTGGQLSLAPPGGINCRVIETGATVSSVTIGAGKGVVVMGDGTVLVVMGDVV